MSRPDAAPALVVLCSTSAEYVEAASRWRDGAPFPLLPGPVLDRYAAVLAVPPLPGVAVEPREGVVISTGGEFSRAAAGLLAEATRRSHRHVPQARLLAELTASAGQLVAVVALASELSALTDWPGQSGARVGVLTGRSQHSLACLIYRSLTVRQARSDDQSFVVSHPLLAGALDADAVLTEDLGYLRQQRPGLVVLHGQGRECSMSLLDGVVCGRAAPLDVPLPTEPGLRATPCLH